MWGDSVIHARHLDIKTCSGESAALSFSHWWKHSLLVEVRVAVKYWKLGLTILFAMSQEWRCMRGIEH